MALFVLFAAVHILMVFYAGPINEMRSMITGRFKLPATDDQARDAGDAQESNHDR